MKITKEQIEKASKSEYQSIDQSQLGAMIMKYEREAFTKGAQWAISKMQPEWVPVEQRTPELIKRLESTDGRLIQCLFDTGEILAFNDEHPFAIMTHYCFLPEPPTK